MSHAVAVPGTAVAGEVPQGRAARLDRVLAALLRQAPEIEAAAVVSFDGLPMASAMPEELDADRVAAMSAALLALGERASEGLGRGELSQVSVEGETGSVHLVSARGEAVLVGVAGPRAKAGLVLFELRRVAAQVADVLLSGSPVDAAETSPRAEAPALAAVPATASLPSYLPDAGMRWSPTTPPAAAQSWS